MNGETKKNINRIYAITCLVTGVGEIVADLLLLWETIKIAGAYAYMMYEFMEGPLSTISGAILGVYHSMLVFLVFTGFAVIASIWLIVLIIVFMWMLLYFIIEKQSFRYISIISMTGVKTLVAGLCLVFIVFFALGYWISGPSIWIVALEVLLFLLCCAMIVFSGFILITNITGKKDNTNKSGNQLI